MKKAPALFRFRRWILQKLRGPRIWDIHPSEFNPYAANIAPLKQEINVTPPKKSWLERISSNENILISSVMRGDLRNRK